LSAFARYAVVLLLLLFLAVPAARSRPADSGSGSFASSDPFLNRIWQDSVTTAADMVVAARSLADAGGSPCAIDLPVVIVDGTDRDRCLYIGDPR
jgi:hypothetical protein